MNILQNMFPQDHDFSNLCGRYCVWRNAKQYGRTFCLTNEIWVRNEFGMISYLLLGFQVKQMKDGVFVSQTKYVKNIVKSLVLKILGTNVLLLPLMSNLLKMIKE